jgi:hypothetical protein
MSTTTTTETAHVVRTVRVDSELLLPLARQEATVVTAFRRDDEYWGLVLPPAPEVVTSISDYGWELDSEVETYAPELVNLLCGKNLRGWWVPDERVHVMSDVWALPNGVTPSEPEFLLDDEPFMLDGEPNRERIAALIREKTDLELELTRTKSLLEARTGDVTRVSEQRDRIEGQLRGAREAHASDIQIIGERLIAEAQRREWCSEYDSIIGDLNGRLNVELPEREKDWTVEMDVTVRVRLSVRATDSETAEEIASGMDLAAAVYNLGRYDVDIQDHTVVDTELDD